MVHPVISVNCYYWYLLYKYGPDTQNLNVFFTSWMKNSIKFESLKNYQHAGDNCLPNRYISLPPREYFHVYSTYHTMGYCSIPNACQGTGYSTMGLPALRQGCGNSSPDLWPDYARGAPGCSNVDIPPHFLSTIWCPCNFDLLCLSCIQSFLHCLEILHTYTMLSHILVMSTTRINCECLKLKWTHK